METNTPKPLLTVFSAQGRDTFSEKQASQLESKAQVQFYQIDSCLTDREIVQSCKDTEYLAITPRVSRDVHQDILKSLPHLKGVILYSTGYEWIDTGWLSRQGIPVSYSPGYSTRTVAEHTLSLLLCMTRRTHLSHDRSRGIVEDKISLRGSELSGRSIGIIGMGRIGQRVSALLAGFDISLSFCDPKMTEFKPYTKSDLPDLLTDSNIIILCANHHRGATPIISEKELSKMRQDCLLINPARAALVDHLALIGALQEHRISGYAIDDQLDILTHADVEPGRILQTCHTAWYSDASIERGTRDWTENILAMLDGHPENLVEAIV